MLLESKELINQEVFDFLRNDNSCSFMLLKRPEEMTETEKRYSKYRFNKEPELIYDSHGYYVARNWGVGNIQPFIQKMEAKFPGLNYSIENN
jgi:hypothetical protein